jgi:hypothetical protein
VVSRARGEAVIGKIVKIVVFAVVAAAIIVFAPQLIGFLGPLLGTAIAQAVVSAAFMMAASQAIGGTIRLVSGAPTAKGAGTPTVFRQSITDSFIVYGRRRVGGMLAFFHARVLSGVHFRYFVIAVAGHRCKGVVSWYLNDEQVSVNATTGAVTSGVYSGAAWLWFQRGLASETANATFVAESGGRWTSAHKGNGTAAIYAKFRLTDDVVEAGMPNITAVIDGKDDIVDPRTGTAGFTRNAALIFYDWMRLSREEGGFGSYADEIPDDDWISAQANVCDETVDGELRYAIDAVITTGAVPSEIRDVLTVNCAGSYTYSGGQYLMRPGYYVPVSETLSEDDLSGAIQVSAFISGDQAANEVQGTFIDPGAGYQGAPFDTQSAASSDIRQMDLDLAFITSKTRANRIAKIMLNRALAEKTVVWPMNIAGLKVRALDTVQLDTARYGLSNYAFTVTNWGMSSDFGVVLSLREENEEIYGAPAVVAPPSIPTIGQAEVVTPTSAITTAIATSYARDLAGSIAQTNAGSSVTVVVPSHTRVYPAPYPEVTVAGGTLSGLAYNTTYIIYYDDPGLAGGAVSYHVTTAPADGYYSALNPFRHNVGYIQTMTSGGTGGGGGGGGPGGSGGWQYNRPYEAIP